MKYVATHRIKLVESIYDFAELAEVTADGLTKDIHDCYPAPIEVVIPNSTAKKNGYLELIKISENLLQLFSIWYNRGTRIILNRHISAPQQSYRSSTPEKHSTMNGFRHCLTLISVLKRVTPDKAYEYGKTH